ncbi:MAG: glycosyl transferase [Epsilonproteobacteria bacterium]|nr:glycosyl transferase [Campylobacterota bacterium]
MSDFFQNGVITTIPRLGSRTIEDMEEELLKLSQRRNMVLILPALYSEFETPAMKGIVEELKKVNYLYKIILGLDAATQEQFEEVKEIMSVLPTPVDVIWNDGPRVMALKEQLKEAGFQSTDIKGKGLNVWMMLGYVLSDQDAYAIALHDCDIVNYTREIPARLLYPIVHPAFDYEFNKGYYSRVTDKLHGRATRLFYTPLIRSLEKIFGKSRYLDYMSSFRYSLSGEFAFIRSLARGIRISPTWGLEVSTLSEVYHNTSKKRICQSEIMETYEHKHQDLGKEAGGGVAKMTKEIAETIFRIMSQTGVTFSNSKFKSLQATYLEESRRAIAQYSSISAVNGLHYDRHKEISAIQEFTESLRLANEDFNDDPMGVPALSAWTAVRSVLPNFTYQFKEAVELDKKSS